MSSFVEYTEERKSLCIYQIYELVKGLYASGSCLFLGVILAQIYEFSVWSISQSKDKPFSSEDLLQDNNSTNYTTMVNKLVKIHDYVIHQPLSITQHADLITSLLTDDCFKQLLNYRFGEHAWMFDEMLDTYKRWLYR